jgi:hypothetical protein
VKPCRLSVAIAVAVALFFAPLFRAIADQRCDMLGRSDSEGKKLQRLLRENEMLPCFET